MRILITGGLGYLGSRLAHYLDQKGNEVIVASRDHDKSKNLSKRILIQVIDWKSETSINQACKECDIVIHAAGMNADSCKKDPVAALDFNGVVTAKLIRSALLCKVSKFIYFSTAHVYSECLSGYFDENSCTMNLHPYATTHKVAEDMVLHMTKGRSMLGVVLRLSNVFGSPVHSKVDCWELFVNNICKQAVLTNEIHLKTLGTQYRNFLPMESLCTIVEYFLSSKSFKNIDSSTIYNIGSETAKTIYEVALLVKSQAQVFLKQDVSLVVDNGNNKLISGKPLIYSLDKILAEDILLVDYFDKEINTLLLFCKNNFHVNK